MHHKRISIQLCERDLKNMCSRYHFKDSDLVLLQRTYRECFSISQVSVYYMKYIGYNNEKAINKTEERNNCFAVLMTLGQQVDDSQSGLMEAGHLSEAYAVECLSMEILSKAYEELEGLLEQETGMSCGEYFFPGSDGSMEETAVILDTMKQCEVRYNEAYALIPQKSVVYIIEMKEVWKEQSTKAVTEEKESVSSLSKSLSLNKKICASCNRKDCTERIKENVQTGIMEDERTLDTNYNYGYQRIFGGQNKPKQDFPRR